jgi:molybdopterin synthase sulfur carrier subunit
MRVRLFANYRAITGQKAIDLPAPVDMLALLTQLSEQYGAELRRWLLSPDGSEKGEDAIVLVNGRHIEHLQGVQTPLTEQDVVSLFPLVAGG